MHAAQEAGGHGRGSDVPTLARGAGRFRAARRASVLMLAGLVEAGLGRGARIGGGAPLTWQVLELLRDAPRSARPLRHAAASSASAEVHRGVTRSSPAAGSPWAKPPPAQRSAPSRRSPAAVEQFVLDNIEESVILHRPSGHVVYANRAAWEARGYTKEQFMALPPYGWAPQAPERHPDPGCRSQDRRARSGALRVGGRSRPTGGGADRGVGSAGRVRRRHRRSWRPGVT